MNKYLFTVRDALAIAYTYDNPDYNYYDNTPSLLLKLGTSFTTYTSKVYGEEGVSQSGLYQILEELDIVKWTNNHYVLNDHIKKLLDILSSRIADEYCMITDFIDDNTIKKATREFMDKLISLLSLTYPKYKELLDAYESTKGKLLNALEDSYVDYENVTEEGSNINNINKEHNSFSNRNSQQADSKTSESSGKSHMNDTPQNAGTYDNEDFASSIEFADSNANESGSINVNENDLNVNNDKEDSSASSNSFRNRGLYHISSQQRDALIDRLELINRNYQNLLEKWTKEFYPLCWERGTYEG